MASAGLGEEFRYKTTGDFAGPTLKRVDLDTGEVVLEEVMFEMAER